MVAERLEVRLDQERRKRLQELAADRRVPVSELVRQLIDGAYEDRLRDERRRAARELAAMEVEDVPDMETLRRQLDSAHDPGVP
jgi:hypothetical protein